MKTLCLDDDGSTLLIGVRLAQILASPDTKMQKR